MRVRAASWTCSTANAKAASHDTSFVTPVYLDGKGGNPLAPIHIQANTAGITALTGMISEYFERHIERHAPEIGAALGWR